MVARDSADGAVKTRTFCFSAAGSRDLGRVIVPPEAEAIALALTNAGPTTFPKSAEFI